jgi:ApbE superfamily uncharacterized protein (UPF0280 family)
MNKQEIFKKRISIEETKMNVISDIDIEKFKLNNFIKQQRNELKEYINQNPLFAKALSPYKTETNNSTLPEIIQKMISGANIANVGPTATLAGTIAEISLDYLIKNGSSYSILDNGGDIAFLNNNLDKKIIFGIYAGDSVLSGKIGMEFKPKKHKSLGVCSSSGSVGYSLSYGRSDCVTVIANKASIADGLATSIGNKVNGKLDLDAVENGLAFAEEFKDHFIGALIIVGESLGTIGKIPKIVKTNDKYLLNDFKNK